MGVELPIVPAVPLLEAQEVDPVEVSGLVDVGVPLEAVGVPGALTAVDSGAVAGPGTAGAGLGQLGGLADGRVESLDAGAVVVALVSVAVCGGATA